MEVQIQSFLKSAVVWNERSRPRVNNSTTRKLIFCPNYLRLCWSRKKFGLFEKNTLFLRLYWESSHDSSVVQPIVQTLYGVSYIDTVRDETRVNFCRSSWVSFPRRNVMFVMWHASVRWNFTARHGRNKGCWVQQHVQ